MSRHESSGTLTSHWPGLWALGMGVASLSSAEMLPMSLLSPMAEGLNITEGLAGQTVSASAIVALVTSLFIAPLIRGIDRRQVLLALSIAQVVSNLVVATAPTFTLVMVGRLLLGIAVGGFWGLSASLALRLVTTEHLAKALSIIFGGGAVAGIAAAPLGAFLSGLIGWRGVFYAAAVLAVAALVGQLLTLPSMPAITTTSFAGLWHTIKAPTVAAGMVGVLLMFGGRQAVVTYLRPFLEQVTHLGVTGVSLALLTLGVFNFAGTAASSRLLTHNLVRTQAVLSAVMAALAVTLLLLGANAWVTYLVIAGWGFASGVMGVGWSTWLTRSIPERAESGGGILVATIQIALMIGAALGGVAIDSIDATGPALVSAVILAAGALHVALALHPRTRERRPAVRQPPAESPRVSCSKSPNGVPDVPAAVPGMTAKPSSK